MMRTTIRPIALALLLICGAADGAAAQRQAPPAPGTPRPFQLPRARELTLPNGLGVTLVEYGEVPKVTVQLVSRVGNADEAPNQVWLADVMAELMEEGTTNVTGEQMAGRAADMGGALTAAVGANTTSIGGSVLAEFAPQMVELVADVARNPSFPASQVERIRADRLRQLSIARSQPGQLAVEKFRSVLYPGHAYGRIFPSPEMLQAYTVEMARDFYTRNFHAGRSHLYVVGRFDVAATEAAIRRGFSDWKGGAPSPPDVPSPRSARAVHLVNKPGAVQSTIHLGLPVVDPSHPDFVALQVTNTLLGGSSFSRIFNNLREQKGYTYSPNSALSSRYRDAYWAQTADVATNVTGASLKEIFYEIDRLRAEAPTTEELRGIQNYLAGTFVLQNSSRAGIINQLSTIDLHGLPDNWLETYVQRIHAVTPAEVQRMARTYLDPTRMAIVVVGDRAQIEEQVRPYGEIRTD